MASQQMTDAVRRFTAPLKKERPDVVIMGCTHYPLMAPMLQRHLGRDVTLVNPAAEIAREVDETLERQGIDRDDDREGRTVSTAPARWSRSAPSAPGSCKCPSRTSAA